MNAQEQIKQQVGSDRIVLYMKGTPDFPQCGFSGRSVQLLNACGASFTGVDVLSDPEIREGIKAYSNWPTIPQLYVKGELVGGCDIMTEMFHNGELQKLVSEAMQR